MKKFNNKFLVVFAFCFLLLACKESEAESRLSGNWLTGETATIKSGVIRLVIGGVSIESLRFNPPGTFDKLMDSKTGVFHPEGGNVKYRMPPEGYLAQESESNWYFNAELEIPGLQNDEIEGSSELTAYLTGISKEVCLSTNQKISEIDPAFKIEGIPRLETDQSEYYTKQMIDDGANSYILPVGKKPELSSPVLKGRVGGCFESYEGGTYVYYRVLIER